jgi:hypothetical protein
MRKGRIEYLRGAGSMTVYVGKFTMTSVEISAVQAQAANFTSDPFGSPVFHLRSLLGV